MGTFLKTLIALMLGFSALSASADGADIQVKDSWIRTPPPGVDMLAAYMEIKNNSDKPQTLTRVSSPAFGQVSIHRSVMHGNMAHMEHVKELAIPAHTSVVLEPGGLHLMLMDAKKPLHAGDQVSMTLAFSNGKKLTFDATVRADKMGGMEDHQHMNHSGHGSHNP